MIYDIFTNCNWVTPGGSSIVHIYTQTIHRTTKNNIENTNNNRTTQITTNWEECRQVLQIHCGAFAIARTKDPMLSADTNAATDKEKYIYLWVITCSVVLHTINIYPKPALLRRHNGPCRNRAATSAWFRKRIYLFQEHFMFMLNIKKTLTYSARGEPMVSQLGHGDRSCAWWWTEPRYDLVKALNFWPIKPT